MLRTKVSNLGMFTALRLAELAINGHFGHSDQSEASENGPNEFLIPKNLGIDTKNKSLACSEQKFQIWACLSHYDWPNWPKITKNGHFGHSGQSEVSENGPIEFPIPKNLGIDTKNKSLACSEPKLQIWACLSHYESLGASYVKIRLNLYIYVEIPS